MIGILLDQLRRRHIRTRQAARLFEPMTLDDLVAMCAASRTEGEPAADPEPETAPVTVCCEVFDLTGFQHTDWCKAEQEDAADAAKHGELRERFPIAGPRRPLITDKRWLKRRG